MDLFDLVAKLSLDSSKYEEGLSDAESKASSVGGGIAKGLGVAAKVGAAAITTAVSGIAAITGAATNAYASFEQLEGGIQTLFGTQGMGLEEYAKSIGKTTAEAAAEYTAFQQAQTKMTQNAQNAFATAGLSMNEYMETAIQSSAAMISSLEGDTNKAADLVDLSIRDMSDNVNKMGTTMEAIQNAYRGFSRGNFTMLDNLALGFSGTKKGMQELLDKAQEISGVEFNISSYADIVQAIHVVQEEMGITGTTASEAAGTISGSFNSLKAAWSNVLVGIADENADFGTQIDVLVDTAVAYANNMIPRIETAIGGVGRLITNIAPVIADKLPGIVEDVVPNLITAAMSAIESFVSAMPKLVPAAISVISTLIQKVAEQLPTLINSLAAVIVELVNGLSGDVLPTLIPSVISAILGVVQAIFDNLPTILSSLLNLIMTIVNSLLNDGLPLIIAALPSIIKSVVSFIVDSHAQIIHAVVMVIQAIVDALPMIIEMIVPMIPEIVISIIEAFMECGPDLCVAFIELFAVFLEALPQIIVDISSRIPTIVEKIGAVFKSKWSEMTKMGLNSVIKFTDGMVGSSAFKKIRESISNIWQNIKSHFGEIITNATTWGKDLLDNFISGIKSKISAVTETIKGVAESVKDFLGFSEPEKGPLSNFHTFAPDMMDLFAQGIKQNEDVVTDQIAKSFDFGDRLVDVQKTSSNNKLNTGSDDKKLSIIIDLLNKISGMDIVRLDPDEDYMYNVIRKKNQERIKITGVSGLV